MSTTQKLIFLSLMPMLTAKSCRNGEATVVATNASVDTNNKRIQGKLLVKGPPMSKGNKEQAAGVQTTVQNTVSKQPVVNSTPLPNHDNGNLSAFHDNVNGAKMDSKQDNQNANQGVCKPIVPEGAEPIKYEKKKRGIFRRLFSSKKDKN